MPTLSKSFTFYSHVDVPDHKPALTDQNRHGYKFAWYLNCYAQAFLGPLVYRHYSTACEWQNNVAISADANRHSLLRVVPETSPDFQFGVLLKVHLFE